MPSKKKPPKPATKSRQAKRTAVVAGVLAGKKTVAIARDAATTPRTVQRILAEPETQFLVTEILSAQRKALTEMAAHAVRVVRESFRAQRCVKVSKDEWEWHGDAIARLRAVERYADLLALAQGKIAEVATEAKTPQWTWEEITKLYTSQDAEDNPVKPQ